ncbi:NADH kinase pos5 [Dimargaris xerosporica]|nr:NADH kinase pos5 [Dimargaris xerosporica]
MVVHQPLSRATPLASAPRTDHQRTESITQHQHHSVRPNPLRWVQQPRTVLIVKKPNDQGTDAALVNIVQWLSRQYPHVNVVLERPVAEQFASDLSNCYVVPDAAHVDEYARVIDYVITLGGDGTILHISSLFSRAIPPVISFSMGTLGFLLPFHIDHYPVALAKLMRTYGANDESRRSKLVATESSNEVTFLMRMRLSCSIHQDNGDPIPWYGADHRQNYQVMNEVHVHRGRFPHLTCIDCYVDNEYLTNAVADGLIVATPTGSTAYSLSAGGPIVHPSLDSLIMTPICPRSLSFRPILLPACSVIRLKISAASRGTAEVSLDGRSVASLKEGQYLEVQVSPYPVPCINRAGNNVDWARDINQLLKFNQNFASKQQILQSQDHDWVDPE